MASSEAQKHTRRIVMWINHFSLLPGDSSLTTSFDAVNSGVGGGLTALVIMSSTLGSEANGGGNKVVQTAVEAPPHYLIEGVRLCYELTSQATFITQIRLAQVQNPPSTALVLLDDGTPHTNLGPVCVDSQPTTIDPSAGAVLLDLRVNCGNTADKIAIRGVALLLRPA
jgi:hypothetical protein